MSYWYSNIVRFTCKNRMFKKVLINLPPNFFWLFENGALVLSFIFHLAVKELDFFIFKQRHIFLARQSFLSLDIQQSNYCILSSLWTTKYKKLFELIKWNEIQISLEASSYIFLVYNKLYWVFSSAKLLFIKSNCPNRICRGIGWR